MIEARALLCTTFVGLGLSNALTPSAHALCLSTDTSKDTSNVTSKITTNAASRARPNIIVILADDLGWGDLSVQGNQAFKTPAVDRLATEGTRFTQGYQAASTCTPTRAALLTGRFPAELQLFSPLVENGRNAALGNAERLDPDVPTIADILRRAGYQTVHIGKWHLTVGATAETPLPYGFDRARWVDLREGERDLATLPERPTNSATLVDTAIEEIDRAQATKSPFYMQLWLSDPHAPVAPSEQQRAPFRRNVPEGITAPDELYAAAVTELDRQIGRFLDALDARKLTENTLVLFTSDNGPATAAMAPVRWSAAGSAGPFRGGKRSLYEGGIRAPWIARWPNVVTAGVVDRESVICGLDLAPTLAALVDGVEVEPATRAAWDGVDFSAALRGANDARDPSSKAREPRARPLFWEWRYPIEGPVFWKSPMLAVRDGDWKYLWNPDGSREELFNVATDPSELREVSAQHPEVTARLRAMLRAWYEPLSKDGTRAEAGRLPAVP